MYGKYRKPNNCTESPIQIDSITVGKAKREPGYNYDGTIAEDMLFGDKPVKSHSIIKDSVYKENDVTLGLYLDQLMKSLSIGEMETVALEMSAKFQNGSGGIYKSNILNNKVANNIAFIKYHYDFLEKLKTALKMSEYDPKNLKLISMGLLNFSSFWDKVSGLGITIHQIWSIKAELKNYVYSKCTKFWTASLVYTMYDHFGLDWDDIVKHGNDRIPQYHTGDFFKAWYILQHYRKAKPFITEIEKTVYIGGNSNYD